MTLVMVFQTEAHPSVFRLPPKREGREALSSGRQRSHTFCECNSLGNAHVRSKRLTKYGQPQLARWRWVGQAGLARVQWTHLVSELMTYEPDGSSGAPGRATMDVASSRASKRPSSLRMYSAKNGSVGRGWRAAKRRQGASWWPEGSPPALGGPSCALVGRCGVARRLYAWPSGLGGPSCAFVGLCGGTDCAFVGKCGLGRLRRFQTLPRTRFGQAGLRPRVHPHCQKSTTWASRPI